MAAAAGAATAGAAEAEAAAAGAAAAVATAAAAADRLGDAPNQGMQREGVVVGQAGFVARLQCGCAGEGVFGGVGLVGWR